MKDKSRAQTPALAGLMWLFLFGSLLLPMKVAADDRFVDHCSARSEARRQTQASQQAPTLSQIFQRLGLGVPHAYAIWNLVSPERYLPLGETIEYVRSGDEGVAWILLFASSNRPIEVCRIGASYKLVRTARDRFLDNLSDVDEWYVVRHQKGDAGLGQALARHGIPAAVIDDLVNKRGIGATVKRFGADSGPVLVERKANEWLLCLKYAEHRWYAVRSSEDNAGLCRLSSTTYAERFDISSNIYNASPLPSSVTADIVQLVSFLLDIEGGDLQPADRFEVLLRRWVFHDVTVREEVEAIWFYGMRKQFSIHRHGKEAGDKPRYVLGSGNTSFSRLPVDYHRVSSKFGNRVHPIDGVHKHHNGIDFAAKKGEKVYASAAGKVVALRREDRGSWGKYVRLEHFSGKLQTIFAHLDTVAAGLGKDDHVRVGQLLGTVGETGRVTGPHLHYQLEVLGADGEWRPIDPQTGSLLAPFTVPLTAEETDELHKSRQRHRRTYDHHVNNAR